MPYLLSTRSNAPSCMPFPPSRVTPKYYLSVCISFRTGPIWALSQTVRVLTHSHCSCENYFSISEQFFPDVAPHFLSEHDSPSNLAESRLRTWYSVRVARRYLTNLQKWDRDDDKFKKIKNMQIAMMIVMIGKSHARLILYAWLWKQTHSKAEAEQGEPTRTS